MRYRKVKVVSITPEDRFHRIGAVGEIAFEYVKVGGILTIIFDNKGVLHTSLIKEISTSDMGMTIRTMNSTYVLEYLKEDK